MTSVETLWLITVREIRERLRSKAFVISAVLTLVLLLAAIALPTVIARRTATYTVGLVGSANEAIVDSALSLGNRDVDEGDGGVEIDTVRFESVAAAESALDEGTVDAVLVEGSAMITPAGTGAGSSSLEGLLQRSAAAVRLDALTGEAARAATVLSEDVLDVRSLDGRDSAETDARVFVAFGGLVLMYMAILTYGTWTLTGVTEEKTNRVVEVLLAAVEPWQLLAGKILGIGLLGLGQFLGTIGIALAAVRLTGAIELPAVPVASLPMLMIWFVLGFALYAVGMGAAGALVSRLDDAQSVASPFTVMSIAGFFISIQVLDDPSSVLARVTSMLPPTAPFAAPVRAAFGAMPWWEMAIAIAGTVAAILALVRFAGRAYTGGLLQFGTKLGWRDAIRSSEV